MESVVSDNYIYETVDRATDSYQYRTVFLSEGSTYGLGDIVRIPIPPIQNGFLNLSNTYLDVAFEVAPGDLTGTSLYENGASNVRMSHIGINSAFNQVNFLSGGNYIQHYQHYQPMFAINAMNNTNYAAAQGNSITNGMGNYNEVTTAFRNSRGNSVALTGTNATANGVVKDNYCPSLMGMFAGVRHLPLTWLSQDSAIEIYLTEDIKNILFNGDTGGTITGTGEAIFTISLNAQIDIVSDNSLRKIEKFCDFGQGAVSWSDTQQRASMNSVTKEQLNTTVEQDVTHIITGIRPRKLLSVVQAGFRTNSAGNVDRWAFINPWYKFQTKIGATYYPPRPIERDNQHIDSVLQCYNQNGYTVNQNKTYWNGYRRRFLAAAVAITSVDCGSTGVNYAQFDLEGDGLDSSQVSMETIGTLAANDVPRTGLPAATQAQDIELYTVKRFGVLYSVSPEGDLSISY